MRLPVPFGLSMQLPEPHILAILTPAFLPAVLPIFLIRAFFTIIALIYGHAPCTSVRSIRNKDPPYIWHFFPSLAVVSGIWASIGNHRVINTISYARLI